MLLPAIPYRLLSSGVAAVLPALAPLIGGKLARGVHARRRGVERMEAWGQASRDIRRPLLWLHASSVGEGLQAEAVLQVLRARHPDWQVVYTHFSPSAESLAARQEADLADYLPWDTHGNAQRALEALRPSALVFAKGDLWPELACQAAHRGIGVGLIAATVSPLSGRLRWPAANLLQPGYAAVTAAGAIAKADGERLARLGTPAACITVLGDPRFDSVLHVIASTDAADPVLRFRGGPAALLAGSTWPADEVVVLQAFAVVRQEHPDARLIVAPHEPTAVHLASIRTRARALGLGEPVLLDAAPAGAPFILVDRVGVLARLYGSAALAHVGGGFGRAGLHSVVEPAGWGIPVSVGPRWQASREAGMLVDAGGAIVLDQRDPVRQLATWWSRMLAHREEREAAGRAAAAVVEAGRGSAVRLADLVERLVQDQRLRTATPS